MLHGICREQLRLALFIIEAPSADINDISAKRHKPQLAYQ